MKKKLALVLLIFMSLTLFGCQKNEETQNTTQSDVVVYKDTVNVAITAQPPNLDPPLSSSNLTLEIAMHFFEPLFAMNKDYVPQPMLAEGYEVNEDFTEYIIKIRPGIKFHDGKDLLAEDVAASMNYWLANSSRAKNILGEGNFEVVDDTTVKVSFKSPARDFIVLAASRANMPAIRTKAAVESATEEGIKDYNGTGPYKFVEWKQDQYIHLTRNENYQPRTEEPSGYAGKKEALTENIYYRIVTDEATRMAGMITGEYDITNEIASDNYDDLKSNENLSVFTNEGGTLTLFFNTQQGPLKDFAMRDAVIKAFNCSDIMLSSYVHEDLYTLDFNYMNPNMKQWHSDAGKEKYNIANIEEAKKAIEAAGYNGETVRVLTTPDYSEMYSASLVVQQQLTQAGINAEVIEFDFPTFMETKGDLSKWEIFITSNGYQVLPQQMLIVNPDWAGANSPRLQELIQLVKTAETQEEASARWKETQAFLYNEYLSSYAIGQYNNVTVINNKVEGFKMFESTLLWNVKVAE